MHSPYFIINNGCGSRVSANINYTSRPDITLVNSNQLVCSWSVEEDPMGSDHLPIVISVSIGGTHPSIGSEYTKRLKLTLIILTKKSSFR